jgi:hypothetical protein
VAVAELLKTSDAIDMLSTQVPKMVKEAKSLIDVLNSTTTTTDETREAQERLNEITKSLAGLFPELARELETNLAGALAKVSKATKLQTKLQLTLYKIQLSEAIEKTSDAYEEAAKNVDKYKSRVDVLKDATMKLADGEEKCQLDLAEFTKIQRGSLAGLSMMVHPLGRLSVGFEDLTNELSKQSSKLVAANSQLSLMRQRIASLVKVQLKMGEVTEDDVDAFAHANEGTARYRKALINIASAIGEHTDLIEDAREEIIAMTQATEEAGKQTRKTAEEITKSIENISKDWKSLGELIKKIRFEFDLNEIERAQLEFDILRGQETEAFDEVKKNIRVQVKDVDSALDDIIEKYEEYLSAKFNISKVEDEATKKRLSDNLAIFKKSIDKGLAELKLNESEVAKIAETRITIAREEAAEKKTFTAEELASFRENESAMTATLHENLRMRSGDTSATLEDIIKKYKDYVNASLAIANIENFAIRQAREKDLANFKDAIDARLAALGIEEKVIIELINSRTVAIEAESKIREAKAKEIEDLANKEIKAGEPVYETEVERAKRVLSVWQNVLNGLKRQGFERTKEYEKVNDLVLQSERNLAKAIRKIEVEKNRKRIQSELEVLQTLSSAAQELPTMSRQKAKELIAQLKASSAELPPYLNQVVTQMKNMLSDLADHNNRVNKEVRDNYILALGEQFDAEVERRKKDIESYGELKDEVEKIEKAKTDFVIKNAGNEVVAAQKRNDVITKLLETQSNLAEMTSKKQIDTAVKTALEFVKANRMYFDDFEEVNKLEESLWKASRRRISEIALAYEQETLKKIANAKTTSELENAMKSIDIAELSREGKRKVRETEKRQFDKFLKDRIRDVELALAKQSQIEQIAIEAKIEGEHKALEDKLKGIKEDLLIRKASADEIRNIDLLIARNRELQDARIKQSREDLLKKTELEMLKFEKKTTQNSFKEAKLRIEIASSEAEEKLRLKRIGFKAIAEQAEKGSAQQIAALQEVEKINNQIGKLRIARGRALRALEAAARREAIQDEIQDKRKLNQILGEEDDASLSLEDRKRKLNEELSMKKLELSHERALALERIQDVDDFEARRIAIIVEYNEYERQLETEHARKIKQIEEEEYQNRINLYTKLMNATANFFEKMSTEAGDSSAQIAEALNKIITVVENIETAFEEPSAANIVKAVASVVDAIDYMLNETARRENEAAEERTRRLKKHLDEMKSLTATVASGISDALMSGFEIDFDELVRQFVRAQLAEKIATIFAEQFGPQFDLLRRGLASAAKAAEVLTPEAILKQQEEFQKLLFVGGLPTLREFLKGEPREIQNLFAELAEDNKLTQEELELLARRTIALRFGIIDTKQVFANMKNDFKALEPQFLEIVDTAGDVFGDFGDEMSKLGEQIPTATFRAVTEPQANQMLVLLGRQTDYLAQISSNTARLAAMPQQAPVQQANGDRAIAAAPALNQNININEKLDINIAGEQRLQVARPEDMDVNYIAGIISQRQQALIDQREVALGRSRIRTRRTR